MKSNTDLDFFFALTVMHIIYHFVFQVYPTQYIIY